ncbi:MAG: hypothetical protein ACTSQI_19785 [Candidatus Helarchaeota archaeon]
MKILGIILIGIAIFLLLVIYDVTALKGWFLALMVIPNLIVGALLIIPKEKEGCPE